jgi:hypothetical protein
LPRFSRRSYSLLLVLVSLAAIVQLVATSAKTTTLPAQYSYSSTMFQQQTVCYQISTNQYECDIYYPVTQTFNQTILRSFTQTLTLTQTSTTLSTQTNTETSTYTQPLSFAQSNWLPIAILTLLIGCGVGILLPWRPVGPFPQPPVQTGRAIYGVPPQAGSTKTWKWIDVGTGKRVMGYPPGTNPGQFARPPQGEPWEISTDFGSYYLDPEKGWIDVATGKAIMGYPPGTQPSQFARPPAGQRWEITTEYGSYVLDP